MTSTMMMAGRLTMRPFDAGRGRRRHPDRQVDIEAGENPLEVAAPADGDGHRADGVLEDQVPADHPGEDLAERGVGVGVGAARDRDHRGELRVAERGEAAGQAGEHVGEHDGRPGLVGRRGAGQDEDAGPDDRADPEQGQVDRRQRALERLGAVPPRRRPAARSTWSSGDSNPFTLQEFFERNHRSAPGTGVKTASVYLERRRRQAPDKGANARLGIVGEQVGDHGERRRASATTSTDRSSVIPPIATIGLPRPAA